MGAGDGRQMAQHAQENPHEHSNRNFRAVTMKKGGLSNHMIYEGGEPEWNVRTTKNSQVRHTNWFAKSETQPLAMSTNGRL